MTFPVKLMSVVLQNCTGQVCEVEHIMLCQPALQVIVPKHSTYVAYAGMWLGGWLLDNAIMQGI